jgi:hypothetical protein
MKKSFAVLIGIGALCAGIALGWHLAWRTFEVTLDARGLAAESLSIESMRIYVDGQRAFGPPGAYEAALTDRLNWLKARATQPSTMLPLHFNLFDQALVYARLSQSQADRGATQESMRSLDSADALCAQLQMKTCSGTRFVDMVKLLDDRQRARCAAGEVHGR